MSSALILNLLFLLQFCAHSEHRIKRFLIYPQSAPTRHQFITGIGIPVELEDQSVTVGYVFKAQFYLPYNTRVWHTYSIVPEFREKRNKLRVRNHAATDNTAKFRKLRDVWKGDSRWEIYKILEYLIERVKQNGKECLLLAICELVQLRFQYYDQTILSEIIYIILTPSLSQTLVDESSQNLYLEAENVGKFGGICRKKFNQCTLLFLNNV